MERATSRSEQNIFFASIFLLVYFGFLLANAYLLKLEYTIISILQEIFTIPFMLLSLVLLFLSVRIFVLKNYKLLSYAFFSAVLLTLLVITTLGSFFI